MTAGFGMVMAASPQELVDDEQEQIRQQDEAAKKDQIVTAISAEIRRKWDVAYRHKDTVQNRILRNLRQRNGEYDPDKLALLKEQGAPEIYMMLTAVKCRAAKSWIRDALMQVGDRPFTINATPVSDLPPGMMEQLHQRVMLEASNVMAMGGHFEPGALQHIEEGLAEKLRSLIQEKADLAAERLEKMVEDKLAEGRWNEEFEQFISDVVDFPAGILKGPVKRIRERLTWTDQAATVVAEEIDEVERVDPLDFFPAPGISSLEDGYCFQRHRFTRTDLYAMIGVEGYNEDAIRDVLREYENGGLTDWETESVDAQRADANDENTNRYEDERIVALEYWGCIQGKKLQEHGVDGIEDTDRDYPVAAIMVGRHLIQVLLNPDPLGRKPYDMASFENVPGSVWGRGVPDLIRDCQDICNAAARATVVNMGLASGPQVAIDVGSIPPGEDITTMYPWKIWQLNFKNGETRFPIQFFQPNPMVEALMRVYDHFSKQADEHSGIPSYTYGGADVGGAGRTATGLSMLMNSASKAIKNVIAHIDTAIAKIVRRFADDILMYETAPELMGDVQVVARGAISLIAKEQAQVRRIEFLAQTNNPVDMQIMGLDGRAEVLREVAKSLDMQTDRIVPDRQELLRQLMPPPGPPGGGPLVETDPAGNVAGGRDARAV